MSRPERRSRTTRAWAASPTLWATLVAALVAVLLGTLWQDNWLTGERPNWLFYAVVVPASILASALGAYAAARLARRPSSLLEVLAVLTGANVAMQVLELVLKGVYHLLWQYPSLLYLALVMPSGFLLGVYGLARWAKMPVRVAILAMCAGLVLQLAAAVMLSSVPALSTPGS